MGQRPCCYEPCLRQDDVSVIRENSGLPPESARSRVSPGVTNGLLLHPVAVIPCQSKNERAMASLVVRLVDNDCGVAQRSPARGNVKHADSDDSLSDDSPVELAKGNREVAVSDHRLLDKGNTAVEKSNREEPARSIVGNGNVAEDLKGVWLASRGIDFARLRIYKFLNDGMESVAHAIEQSGCFEFVPLPGTLARNERCSPALSNKPCPWLTPDKEERGDDGRQNEASPDHAAEIQDRQGRDLWKGEESSAHSATEVPTAEKLCEDPVVRRQPLDALARQASVASTRCDSLTEDDLQDSVHPQASPREDVSTHAVTPSFNACDSLESLDSSAVGQVPDGTSIVEREIDVHGASQLGHAFASRKAAKEDAESYQIGDIVILGDGVPQEFRSCSAVVTKVELSHCTVVVLDDSKQFGVGECWPGLHDISLSSCSLRLGTSVVINGMTGPQTKHLNGQHGVVSQHPREGHPTFITKPSHPERPHLTVCVVFNSPAAAKRRSALLEPRFLQALDDVALQMTQDLKPLLPEDGAA